MVAAQQTARKFLCVFLFQSVLLFDVVADAATYYVAQTGGNNGYTCAQAQSITTPKATINGGLACLTTAGDRLYIRAGTYAESIYYTNMPATGTQGSPITIASYQNEVVTLAPSGSVPYGILFASTRSDLTFDGLIVDGANMTYSTSKSLLAYDSPVSRITLKNMEFKNALGNCILAAGDQWLIQNVKVHGCGRGTDYGNSNGLYLEQISNSVFDQITTYDNECFGFRIFSSPPHVPANNNIATRILSYTNGTGKGLGGKAACSSAGGGIVIGDVGNSLSNSIAYNNNPYGIWNFSSGGGTRGTTFSNNVAYNNVWGMQVQGGVSTATFVNNHSAGNSSSNFVDGGTGTTNMTNRFTGYITDCTASTGDFRQKSGSACIDAGTTINAVTDDFVRVARPKGAHYDIGAYEATNSTAPAPPTNLVVR